VFFGVNRELEEIQKRENALGRGKSVSGVEHLALKALDETLLGHVAAYHHVTKYQLARLLQKETSRNYIGERLKYLTEHGLLHSQCLPRTLPSGKSPYVYSLTQKGALYCEQIAYITDVIPSSAGYLQHTLELNDVLIASALLEKKEPAITRVEMQHERVLKHHPIFVLGEHGKAEKLIPDAFVRFALSPPFGRVGEQMGLCMELDRNHEDVWQYKAKVQRYCRFADGIYEATFGLQALTVAVVVTDGGQERVYQLLTWTEQELTRLKKQDYAPYFLYASVAPGEIDPVWLFCSPLWVQPFCRDTTTLLRSLASYTRFPLIEKRFA